MLVWAVLCTASLSSPDARAAAPASPDARDGGSVSICDRSLEVRAELLREVSRQRLEAGDEREIRCDAVDPAALARIEALFLHKRELSTLRPGDFDGLRSLTYLDLSQNALTTLPVGLFDRLSSLQTLDLSRNSLPSLEPGQLPLPSLTTLYLEANPLRQVSAGAFERLPELERLVLSDTDLRQLPTGLFAGNPSLRTVDLSDGDLEALPLSLFARNGALELVDASNNQLRAVEGGAFSGLPRLETVNLAGNHLDAEAARGLEGVLPEEARLIVKQARGRRDPAGPTGDAPEPPDSAALAAQIGRLERFARARWHMPLAVRIVPSRMDEEEVVDLERRTREERAALYQLLEVQSAYERTVFDFYQVRILFEPGRTAPTVKCERAELEFRLPPPGVVEWQEVTLPASAPTLRGLLPIQPQKRPFSLRSAETAVDGEAYAIVRADRILQRLAEDFQHDRSLHWYDRPYPGLDAAEGRLELSRALRFDLQRIAGFERALHTDALLSTELGKLVGERARRAGERAFFTESERLFARGLQLRTTLALHRLVSLMVRWRAAGDDPDFRYPTEARILLAQANGVYEAYLDWFLEIVVGGRTLGNLLDVAWYYRSTAYKVLDEELPAGSLMVNGRPNPRIPAGSIREFLSRKLREDMQVWQAGMRELDKDLPAGGVVGSPMRAELEAALESLERVRAIQTEHALSRSRASKELWGGRLKKAMKYPVYSVVAGVSGFLGDTRMQSPAPAVNAAQLEELERLLEPGDLLLVRQDYYLSNLFLPGFWPHTVIYVGPEERWTSLRQADGTTLGDDPWVREHILPRYWSEGDAHPARVIEAVSEGVVFNSVEHALSKDFVAVLRPTFAPGEREAVIAGALKRAFQLHGREYDFDFDFVTDHKIVCSELAYRAYNPEINFLVQKVAADRPAHRVPGVTRVMGRDTMPSNEIARLVLYMADHPAPDPVMGYDGRTLELVRLYLKDPMSGQARLYMGAEAVAKLRESVEW